MTNKIVQTGSQALECDLGRAYVEFGQFCNKTYISNLLIKGFYVMLFLQNFELIFKFFD